MIEGGPGWHIDSDSLLPVLTDEQAFRTAHADDPAVDVFVRLWSGDPDGAAAGLRPLLAADPDRWRWRALVADIERDRGNVASAVETYRALVGEFGGAPQEAVLVQHLGEAYFAAGDYQGAAACFRRSLELRRAAGVDASLIESSRAALLRASELARRTAG